MLRRADVLDSYRPERSAQPVLPGMSQNVMHERPSAAPEADAQERVNARMWARSDLVSKYTGRALRPPEVMILVRYRDAIGPRVLDLGCGAGRLTGYLAELAPDVLAIDVSPAMLEACARSFPEVRTEQRDLRDLGAYEDGAFDTVVAAFNVVDVLSDEDRRAMLDEVHRILTPGGLFIVSTHNRDAAHLIPEVMKAHRQPPLRA